MLLESFNKLGQVVLIFPAVSFQVSFDDVVAFSANCFLAPTETTNETHTDFIDAYSY